MKEKMTEEELQEKYEKEQENIKSLEIETKDGNGESFKNHKKIDLIVKAGAIALAGVITIAGINIARSAKTIQTPEEPTTNQDNTATLSLNEILQKLSLKPKTDFDKTGKDKTSNGYNPKDKAKANKLAGSTGEDETKLVNKGGKPIRDNKGNKETVSEPTTKTSISEKPADVPDKELNKPTETDKGGKVVSTTKEVETTKKIQEEIVEPETETTTEEIVDVKDENGDTVLTDDEYNKLKRENLKNALINREMATLGGVAGLALMSFAFSDKIITASEKISAKIKRKRR